MEIQRTTYTEQIAEDLKKSICGGEYTPGHRLPSVRKMASQYGVSNQAVTSALEVLERQGLIQSLPRVGAFVCKSAVFPKTRLIGVFQSMNQGFAPDYINERLKLQSAELYPKVQLQYSALPMGLEHSLLFDYELERIQRSRPDILLVHIPSLNRVQLDKLSKSSFPVVHIGDFHDQSLYDQRFHMIRENTEDRGKYLIDVAVQNGGRKLVMIGASHVYFYSSLTKEGAEREAKKQGVDFHYVFLPESKAPEKLCSIEDLHKTLSRGIEEFVPDMIILAGNSLQRALPVLREYGYPGEGRQLLSLDNFHTAGCMFMECDYVDFATQAAGLIQRVMDDPQMELGVTTISARKNFRWYKVEDCSPV